MSIVRETFWAQKLLNLYYRDLSQWRFVESPPVTRWTRFKWRVLDARDRVRDAWLVLIGKAHISDD